MEMLLGSRGFSFHSLIRHPNNCEIIMIWNFFICFFTLNQHNCLFVPCNFGVALYFFAFVP